jgi:hypothetical protein
MTERTLGPWLPCRVRTPAAPVGQPTSSRGFPCVSSRTPPPQLALRVPARPFDRADRRSPESRHPSTDIPSSVHSRTRLPARASASREPPSKSCSVPVVSHHLDGFLRSEVAGLLHPAAGHGVRRVSCHRVPGRPLDESRSRRECRCIPRDAFHTPRRIPPDRSRTTSPWPLPPCRSLRPARHLRPPPFPETTLGAPRRGVPTSRLCSAIESVTPSRPFPAGRRPILPGLRSPSRAFLSAREHPPPAHRRRIRNSPRGDRPPCASSVPKPPALARIAVSPGSPLAG